MKKLLFIMALFTLGYARAQSEKMVGADAILHIWETEEKDGRMQLIKNGNNYDAKMLYGKELVEADGKTFKKDVKNPDPALRSRILKDYTLISGLTYDDRKWVNGKIYNFRDGNSYDVNLELKDGFLYMRVYKGIPILGKTLKWHQVQQ
jgi:uncharacterized protein (DUF2147 family)